MKKLRIPDAFSRDGGRKTSPVYFFDFRKNGIDIDSPEGRDAANGKIREALSEIMPGSPASPALIKIHPGEPKSRTTLIPELMSGQAGFLRSRGVEPVLGDSTVIYTGGRGYAANSQDDVSAYMEIISKNGWDKARTGMDFVVLDRPVSSVKGVFEFGEEEIAKQVDSPGSYGKIFVSGGFDRARTVFNNPHFTLHGMSPIALSVKALTMGCAGASGKKQMHMNLAPRIQRDICRGCGLCVKNCPFSALQQGEEEIPALLPEKCAGCGECMAVCPADAIQMHHSGEITWGRGKDSFLSRLTDFLLCMMNERWDGLVNICHLYRITAHCDCMDIVQKPIIGDIGILVSANPFAADRLAMELFVARAEEEGKTFPLKDYPDSFRDAEERYGLVTEPDVMEI